MQPTSLAAQPEEAALAGALSEIAVEHAAILALEGAGSVAGDQLGLQAGVPVAAPLLLVPVAHAARAIAVGALPARTLRERQAEAGGQR